MQRDRPTQAVAGVLCLAPFARRGVLAALTAAPARPHELLRAAVPHGCSDQGEARGVAMGAFRGLFVNMLWLPANKLKEEGKFHEAMNLSATITRLQPHFPKVWSFHAWNMAYNISVKTNTADERWNWVNA